MSDWIARILVLSTVVGALTATPARAEIFALHDSRTAMTALSDQSFGACAKKEEGWKSAYFLVYRPYGPDVKLDACWKRLSTADSARLHLKPNVIAVCPLPNKIVPTTCSYILADEFVAADSLPPPPPKPAFPNN
jgi:hypothetical protein